MYPVFMRCRVSLMDVVCRARPVRGRADESVTIKKMRAGTVRGVGIIKLILHTGESVSQTSQLVF